MSLQSTEAQNEKNRLISKIKSTGNKPAKSSKKAITANIEKSDSLAANTEDSTNTLKTIALKYLDNKSFKSGVFYLTDLQPDVHLYINENTDTIVGKQEVKRVSIEIREGRIIEIIVDTDKDTFKNRTSSISIPYFENAKDDRLYNRNSSFLILTEVIDFKKRAGYSWIPDDTLIELNSEKPISDVSTSTSLNVLADVVVYSDMLALFSKEPNGLVQTEIAFKIMTNTRNISWFGHGFALTRYIKPFFSLAKFDSEFQNTNVNTTDTNTVNRTQLLQRTNFSFGLNANIISWSSRDKFTLYLDAGWRSTYANVKKANESIEKINSTNILGTLGFKISNISPINLNMSITGLWQNINASTTLTNYDYVFYLSPQIVLSYSIDPFQKSKLFARYAYYQNTSVVREAFSQIQIGYAANLNDLLKK